MDKNLPLLANSRTLQVNNSGAWKTISVFDEGDIERVKQGAVMLHEASPRVSFRITNVAPNPTALMHLGRNTYGMWMGV